MKRLLIVCAVVGLITAVTATAQAALDIEGIYISYLKEYRDGTPETNPWGIDVWVNFVDRGDLDHIDIILPGGSPTYTVVDDYWDGGYSTLTSLQVDYPVGSYTLEFRDISDTLLNSVPLNNSGLSEPVKPVDFTYPAVDGATGISTNPTFTWTVDSGDGDALGMWLQDHGVVPPEVYWDWPVSMATTSWAPGSLQPNHDYELEVSVLSVKDLQIEPGFAFPTMTVGGDEFEYGLMIEYINVIGFTTVPEPATVVLLGLGSFVLIYKKR